jgi:hypothetical protein
MKKIYIVILLLLCACTKKESSIQTKDIFIQVEVEYQDNTTYNSPIFLIR